MGSALGHCHSHSYDLCNPKSVPSKIRAGNIKKQEVMVLRISDYYSPLYSIRLKFIKGIFYEQLSAVKSFYLSFW
jgi:hypothetical protein